VNSTCVNGGSERRSQGWAGADPSPAPRSVPPPAALQVVRGWALRTHTTPGEVGILFHHQDPCCTAFRHMLNCRRLCFAVFSHLELGGLMPAASAAGLQAVTRRVCLPWS
jgi:hypothetical protein